MCPAAKASGAGGRATGISAALPKSRRKDTTTSPPTKVSGGHCRCGGNYIYQDSIRVAHTYPYKGIDNHMTDPEDFEEWDDYQVNNRYEVVKKWTQ
jgi:hypothetical protein